MGDESRSITISGGNFTDSNVASADIIDNRNARGVTIGDLRTELGRRRAEIVDLAGENGSRAGRAVDDLDEELADPEPDQDVVRGRWRSVLKPLPAPSRSRGSSGGLGNLAW